jgi:hypothetical protein
MSIEIFITFEYIRKNIIAGSYSKCLFSFIRNQKLFFQIIVSFWILFFTSSCCYTLAVVSVPYTIIAIGRQWFLIFILYSLETYHVECLFICIIGKFCSFIAEVSVKVFDPFLVDLLYLLLILKWFLHISDNNPLLNVYLENTFPSIDFSW